MASSLRKQTRDSEKTLLVRKSVNSVFKERKILHKKYYLQRIKSTSLASLLTECSVTSNSEFEKSSRGKEISLLTANSDIKVGFSSLMRDSAGEILITIRALPSDKKKRCTTWNCNVRRSGS